MFPVSKAASKTSMTKWVLIVLTALLVLWFVRHLRNEAVPAAHTSNKNLVVMKQIKKDHGLDTNVSWKQTNGVLEQVTVDFKAAQVRQKNYADLENIALQILDTVYEQQPETLYIRIAKQ